jgi:branched-chain amino acid transport system substrate-binding protein
MVADVAAQDVSRTRLSTTCCSMIPVNDFYVRNGHVREDGRLVHDMFFAQVKTPSESTEPWDYFKILGVIPGDQAFRPLAEGGCPLVAR